MIELHQLLSDNMKDIQNALITVVGACVSELRKSTAVELNDFSVEHLLFRPLDDVIQRQLNSVWHITPKKTKQLVYDLRTLRNFAQELVSQDAISFLNVRITDIQRFWHTEFTVLLIKRNPVRASETQFVETQRAAESVRSIWMYVKGADEIFEASKRRVYTMQTKSRSSGKKRQHDGNPQGSRKLVTVLEPMPKWELLLDIIEEIRGETASRIIDSVQSVKDNQGNEIVC